jgi:myo-inositol-1(or 4)-monophosphatase
LIAAELRRLVDHYLPLLVAAGDYALAIQPRIRGPQPKKGINPWSQAITDADLAIQNYFEVATLALDPALGFFGEEHAQSANTAYFDRQAETVVHLDPVNGTFLYQSGRDGWDILLSISHAERLRAVVSYMPARGDFYLAVDGQALTGRRAEPRLDAMQALALPPPQRACLTYRAPEVVAALRPAFDAFDIVEDDDPVRGLDNLNALFTGGIAAFACHGGDMLDWGALACVVQAAGGVATQLDGSSLHASFERFDPEKKADLLVATDTALHAEILALIDPAA